MELEKLNDTELRELELKLKEIKSQRLQKENDKLKEKIPAVKSFLEKLNHKTIEVSIPLKVEYETELKKVDEFLMQDLLCTGGNFDAFLNTIRYTGIGFAGVGADKIQTIVINEFLQDSEPFCTELLRAYDPNFYSEIKKEYESLFDNLISDIE